VSDCLKHLSASSGTGLLGWIMVISWHRDCDGDYWDVNPARDASLFLYVCVCIVKPRSTTFRDVSASSDPPKAPNIAIFAQAKPKSEGCRLFQTPKELAARHEMRSQVRPVYLLSEVLVSLPALSGIKLLRRSHHCWCWCAGATEELSHQGKRNMRSHHRR
jgi:hypothetical protein